jgi:hypothetical protein
MAGIVLDQAFLPFPRGSGGGFVSKLMFDQQVPDTYIGEPSNSVRQELEKARVYIPFPLVDRVAWSFDSLVVYMLWVAVARQQCTSTP